MKIYQVIIIASVSALLFVVTGIAFQSSQAIAQENVLSDISTTTLQVPVDTVDTITYQKLSASYNPTDRAISKIMATSSIPYVDATNIYYDRNNTFEITKRLDRIIELLQREKRI